MRITEDKRLNRIQVMEDSKLLMDWANIVGHTKIFYSKETHVLEVNKYFLSYLIHLHRHRVGLKRRLPL